MIIPKTMKMAGLMYLFIVLSPQQASGLSSTAQRCDYGPMNLTLGRSEAFRKCTLLHPDAESVALDVFAIPRRVVKKMLNMSPRCKDLLRWLEISVKLVYYTLTKPGSSLGG